jgi:hypothetical protein
MHNSTEFASQTHASETTRVLANNRHEDYAQGNAEVLGGDDERGVTS